MPGRQSFSRVLPEQDDPVPVRIGECDIRSGRIVELEPLIDGQAFIP